MVLAMGYRVPDLKIWAYKYFELMEIGNIG